MTISSLYFKNILSQLPHTRQSIWHLWFWDWLTSLSIMASSCIYFAAKHIFHSSVIFCSVYILHFLCALIIWWISGLFMYLSYCELSWNKSGRVQMPIPYADFISFGSISRIGWLSLRNLHSLFCNCCSIYILGVYCCSITSAYR